MHSVAPNERLVSRLAFAIEWRNHSTVRDVDTRYIICMEENAFVSIGNINAAKDHNDKQYTILDRI